MQNGIRAYLRVFASLGCLGWPPPQLFGGLNRILTVGSLSEEFREELGLPWSRRAELVYEANAKALRVVDKVTPNRILTLAMDLYLWDLRRRIRTHRQLV